MPRPPDKPAASPQPPADADTGQEPPIGTNSAPFDDRPQREDETLSELLRESDPQRKPGK